MNNREKHYTMKNRFRILAIGLTLGLFIGLSTISDAQPGPPPPPEGHGSTGNQSGGMAPVGGGIAILVGLGAAYGTRKLFGAWKKIDE